MVFKRRHKQTVISRLRQAVMPKTGWRRGFEYLGHRVRRLPDTPHKIALGLGCGAFASFSPFFGLHILLAMGLARVLRGNMLAGLIGTSIGNPLTFPFIASLSLGLGRYILGGDATEYDFFHISDAFHQFLTGLWESLWSVFGYGDAQWHKLNIFFQEVWWPYCVGGLLPGIASGLLAYFLSRPLIAAYQIRRRAKMMARIRKGRLRRGKSDTDGAASAA